MHNLTIQHRKIKLFLIYFFISVNISQAQKQSNLSQYVNPFIGTLDGGNTFPGTAIPFGMVKLGPDCGNKRSNSGYVPNGIIHGFSHTHVSGTGGGAKYGNILVMPFSGKFNLLKTQSKPSNVSASPGYFSTELINYNIKAELTCSHSVGFHKYTFRREDTKGILIDAGSFLGEGHCCGEAQELIGSEIKIISNTQIEGYSRVRGGWNKGGEYTVFFTALFDTPADSSAVWQQDKILKGTNNAYDNGEKTGAYFIYNNDGQRIIKVKVGISYISSGKALENITREIPNWDFNNTYLKAVDKWNKVLNKIQVEGASKEMQIQFYTALYHTMLMPTDRTGENPKWKSTEPYYDDYYAIWDTFRATNPLLTLIQPQRETDIVRSLIDIYKYEGYMPDSRSGNQSGRTQGGSNCDMLIADAFLKGLKGINYTIGYQAMIKNAETPPGGFQEKVGRGGIDKYITYGYIPTEFEPHDTSPDLVIPNHNGRAGTRTLEYTANDLAIALVAKGMNKTIDYKKYKKRAAYWANLWNSQIKSEGVVGFIWPKSKTGKWIKDFSVTKAGSWNNCFYEANTWEYSFYVPQDVSSLIDSCGGKEKFIARLDTFFANDHYQSSNEPSFFTPCLYSYAGRPDKTNSVIRNIIKNNYSSQQNGIPGNDDSGSMSAWLVFNSIGFYPNAGQDIYILTTPHFKSVTLDMGENKLLHIITHQLSDKNIYINKVTLNKKPINRSWFRHEEIKNGASLHLYMSNKPGEFGKENLPPSLNDYK